MHRGGRRGCIIGGTALFTPQVLVIDWKPITRDTIFYAISIAAMIYVLANGTVTTEEAGALVATYFLYVLVMYHNESLTKWVAATSSLLSCSTLSRVRRLHVCHERIKL